MWGLWFLTVLLGALSVAVTLFVLMHRQYSFYQVTHTSFLTFMVDVLPYLWIAMFSVMVIFAVYNFRHTKHGYRYPLWKILGSSVILSLAGGALLHLGGVGFSLDRTIGNFSKEYTSQEKLEMRFWQNPEEGRLVGVFLGAEDGVPLPLVVLEDARGTRWEMNVAELNDVDIRIIESGKRVRVLGVLENALPAQFYACAVFPWIYEQRYSMHELGEMKRSMQERILRHTQALPGVVEEGKCSHLVLKGAF
ncbi:hypothetical protein A2929_01970 [Candidatus Kaiserbacteria bacterium RIFCSPLOWO2_01_FULL_45_25]|uniref:Uncharacterized protein n=1 Tax=Candidatus Kaiserbacteria bacterium RIFCSPLOWO2_12_FULL_45_26 TaxID=1798525 RepID=A0A1F6FGM1_9BACT|nr:MAG: hypothetical protein A2Z56_04265 [Candidatus Kaiserbacteria bacterium RIFCSPHIGHO2_12_45_16]OGG71073.1 MAG: hypothetical protein A2929_01970 [Candidatus Kaiserbacteria bacterium RIFCSPLOWO2_01_FULL_45_25]OGG84999.1 MAG: hypothetical protein A3G90_02960 [Candidatus Kaiserbacteria bacterium RIFCSPLOWO2_12_FULL_45_26]